MFYNSVLFQTNKLNYIDQDVDCFESKSKLKKSKLEIDGCFNLISFNKIPVAEFHLKKHLIDDEDTFIKINAVIDNKEEEVFIDLKEHPLLLDRVKLLSVEEASKKINDYVFDILGVDPSMRIFMHLGISDEIDQKTIMSSKAEDIAKLTDLFDKIFPGYTIEQKFVSYEQKRLNLLTDYDCLKILDKIFVNGLAIKIFKDEVSISKLKNYKFIEFKIANQAKTDLEKAIFKASFCGCESLVLFFSSTSLFNLKISTKAAAINGNEFLVNNILLDHPELVNIALKFAVFSNKEKLVENILLKNIAIPEETIKEVIKISIKERNISLIDCIVSKNIKNLTIFICFVTLFDESLVLDLLIKSPNHLRNIICISSCKGFISLIKCIMSSLGVISEDILKDAIKLAIQKDQESMILYLLSINTTNLHQNIIALIFKEKKGLIEKIFDEYSSLISINDLRDFIGFSSQIGCESIVLYLLEKDRTKLGLAIYTAACNGKLHLIKTIFPFGVNISDKELKDSLIASIQKGHYLTSAYFLSKYPELLNFAIYNSSCYGKLDLIESIFPDGITVPDDCLDGSIKISIKNGHDSIALYLLRKNPEKLGVVVCSAAFFGKLDLLQTIFPDEVTISEQDFKDAVKFSAQNNHKSVVFYLLEKDKKYLSIAIYSAAFSGNLDLLQAIFLDEVTISQEDLKNAVYISAQNGQESTVRYLLTKNPANLVCAIKNAVFGEKEELVRSMLLEYKELSSADLIGIIEFAYTNGRQNIFEYVLHKLIPIYIPTHIKNCFLEIEKKPIDVAASWERLIKKLEIYAEISVDRIAIMEILGEVVKNLTKEIPFTGSPKADQVDLLKKWYLYIKDLMTKIDSKIDPDPTKDIEEKKNLLEAFELCGGAWQAHLDQIKQKLVDFPEDIPFEIFIGKTISNIANTISESINKDYSECFGEHPSVHNQNKINFYLREFFIGPVLDDHLSNLRLKIGQVLKFFSERFNLELIIGELLSFIETRSVFKERIEFYYKNELFKGHESNDEIELKIIKDRDILDSDLENLYKIQRSFFELNSIIGDLSFEVKILILNMLSDSPSKEIFKTKVKLLNDDQINKLFDQKKDIDDMIFFLRKIKTQFNNYSYQDILANTKEQFIQSFMDEKQSRIEFYLVEDFESKHTKDNNILSSGLEIILRKLNFLC